MASKEESPMVSLASTISKDIVTLDNYFQKLGLATPSFDANGPKRIDVPGGEQDVADAYDRLLSASRQLHYLLLGPMSVLQNTVIEDVFTLHVIYHFEIGKQIPADGSKSFEELSEATGLPLTDLKRILRHAMTSYIFQEKEYGQVSHTAASLLLAEDERVQGYVGVSTEERLPALARGVAALKRHPDSQEPHLSGWGLAHDADGPLFEELGEKHPKRAERFAMAMASVSTSNTTAPITDNYPWEKLGNGTVIDVGGARGPVLIDLARKYPDLKLINQDLDAATEAGKAELPEDVRDRIDFQQYNFFNPQPISADVYIFRTIFHDWPDKYCVRILQQQVPALKQGARILIYDVTIPEQGDMKPWQERELRNADLRMHIWFNGRDREVEAWREIFADADKNFKLLPPIQPTKNVDEVPHYQLYPLIEAVWDPEGKF